MCECISKRTDNRGSGLRLANMACGEGSLGGTIVPFNCHNLASCKCSPMWAWYSALDLRLLSVRLHCAPSVFLGDRNHLLPVMGSQSQCSKPGTLISFPIFPFLVCFLSLVTCVCVCVIKSHYVALVDHTPLYSSSSPVSKLTLLKSGI